GRTPRRGARPRPPPAWGPAALTPSPGGGRGGRGARLRTPSGRGGGRSFAPSPLADGLPGPGDLQEEPLHLALVGGVVHRLAAGAQRLDLPLQLALPVAQGAQLRGVVRARGGRAAP